MHTKVKKLLIVMCFLLLENSTAMSPYERMLKKEPQQGNFNAISL